MRTLEHRLLRVGHALVPPAGSQEDAAAAASSSSEQPASDVASMVQMLQAAQHRHLQQLVLHFRSLHPRELTSTPTASSESPPRHASPSHWLEQPSELGDGVESTTAKTEILGDASLLVSSPPQWSGNGGATVSLANGRYPLGPLEEGVETDRETDVGTSRDTTSSAATQTPAYSTATATPGGFCTNTAVATPGSSASTAAWDRSMTILHWNTPLLPSSGRPSDPTPLPNSEPRWNHGSLYALESTGALLELELQQGIRPAKESPVPNLLLRPPSNTDLVVVDATEDLRSLPSPSSTKSTAWEERRRTGGSLYIDGPSDEVWDEEDGEDEGDEEDGEDEGDEEDDDECDEDTEPYIDASSTWEDGQTIETTSTIVAPRRRNVATEERPPNPVNPETGIGANVKTSVALERNAVAGSGSDLPPRGEGVLEDLLPVRPDMSGNESLDDDLLSVQSDETPVLERYRIDVDEESPHGFRVVPNPRGLKRRAPPPHSAVSAAARSSEHVSAAQQPPPLRSPASLSRKSSSRVSYKLKKLVPSTPTIDENAPLVVHNDDRLLNESLSRSLSRLTLSPSGRRHPSVSPRSLQRFDRLNPPANSPSERTLRDDDWYGVRGGAAYRHAPSATSSQYHPRLHQSLPSTLLYAKAQLALADHSNVVHGGGSSGGTPFRRNHSMDGRIYNRASPSRPVVPPILPYVSRDEYDGASRVVRMQVTLEEVERSIRALNLALQQGRYWDVVGNDRTTVKYQLGEPEAKRLLHPLGFDDRKAKTVLSCLCHWRRLIVRRPSSVGSSTDATYSKEASMSPKRQSVHHVFEVSQDPVAF